MDIIVITGSAGLIGAEIILPHIVVDAHDREALGVEEAGGFGAEASTRKSREQLEAELPRYHHVDADIRDEKVVERVFAEYGADIRLVVHAASQPSHDWAAKEPLTDFTVNANGTLLMLEAVRRHCPQAVFVFTSTNKVYGDTPNRLPLLEQERRWELDPAHPYAAHGIDENMSIDQSKHSLFGASKAAADLLVQEYGRYFGMKTVCFRGGCLTGPGHSGTQLHGFLHYLMQCALTGRVYHIFGYQGKQVRDNIHSLDLVNMFWHFYRQPRSGEVYNAGGSRHSNCSLLEAVAMCEELSGKKMNLQYQDTARSGDHIWWISDVRRFRQHYPEWEYRYDIRGILQDIYAGLTRRSS
jgi:CDP-paratose 2-epimerase